MLTVAPGYSSGMAVALLGARGKLFLAPLVRCGYGLQICAELRRRVELESRCDMGIDPRREPHVTMTDATGHDADVHASLKQQGRVGMPHVMESDLTDS